MSALCDYNDNFAPQGYYGRPTYSAAPAYHPRSHYHHNHSHTAAAPAAFSYAHNNNNNNNLPSYAAEANAVPVLAERYKTKYCKNYVQYHNCPYEERCMFAHGDEELRSVDDNVRDGLVTEEAIKAFQRQWRHAMLYAGEETQYHQTAAPVYGEEPSFHEDDDAVSTATVPKTVHLQHTVESLSERPVREYLAQGVFRYNPYGTVGMPSKALSLSSRSSSVDNFSSIAGDEDEGYYGWAEESTPQKRPLMSI